VEEYAWISKVAHHPVFSGRSHPILLRLAEHYKVQISIAGPDNRDTEAYVQAVYDAIGRKVAGMMIIGWGNKEIAPAVDAAMAGGIPVVCVDRDIPNSGRYAYIGTDWFRMGRKMADSLADLIPERGKILIAGTTDLDNVKDSVLGFKHQIARYPNIEVLDTIDGLTEDPEQTEALIAGCLRQHPELSGIVGFDGDGSCAAANVLASMGLAGSVKLICVDADAPQFQLVKSGVIDAVFYQKREASTWPFSCCMTSTTVPGRPAIPRVPSTFPATLTPGLSLSPGATSTTSIRKSGWIKPSSTTSFSSSSH
jgi:ribose transport system substrate-binding protein